MGQSAAIAQSASHPPVITRHAGTFNGKKVRYTAAVEGIDVPDAKGKPSARLVSFTYVADDLTDPSRRPVMFVFNGGPITASLWLHIGVMGPKRVAVPEDLSADTSTYQLVDNPYSPLDTADLVFIDPASTGYSHALPGTAPESYYSVVADGQQVTAFISAWLSKHARLSSPAYLLGESYGTVRAAEVAAQLAERPQPILLDGVVLLGQAVNIVEFSQRPQNIISYVVSLPTLAALSWYHQKIDRKGRTLEEFVDEAWHFAQTEYLAALFQGSAIGMVERDRVAKRLEELSGIPAVYYREHGLRITKEQYRAELLKDRGLLLGRTDGRYLAPMTSKGLAEDPATLIMSPFKRLFADYVRNDLKVDWPEEYVIAAQVGGLEDWKWGGTTPFSNWPYTDRLLKVMKANPRFRVLIGNGYFDTTTTIGAAELAVRQAGWPEGRAALAFYEGGHMAYTVERSAKKFTDDIRAFVRTTP
ncbi:MAG: peptidase S10 [Acidobacteriia bacterium]|nr:peptidase S10 [Terriglobia bacterium]